MKAFKIFSLIGPLAPFIYMLFHLVLSGDMPLGKRPVSQEEFDEHMRAFSVGMDVAIPMFYAVLALYVALIFKIQKFTAGQRVKWLFGVIALQTFGMLLFWYFHIKDADRNAFNKSMQPTPPATAD